ncbi:MAG: hypothetical protein HY347_12525 [candidate division NC10 bacterium]|nr:hypothetical protein [candidate division NC10 bacterium]
MAHVYTPGLRVTPRMVIRKRRVLPIPGEVLVREGDPVESSTVVARALLPGKVYTVNVVNRLGISPGEIRSYMLKKEGEPIEAGEPIAESRPFIKWLKTQVLSPITGTIEMVSEVTGQVLVREPPQPLELFAYLDGKVVEVVPKEGAVVETTCAFIQGIFGIGGETVGKLAFAVERPDDVLTPEKIGPEHRGAILIGGSFVAEETIKRAREVGVNALVVGGLNDLDLRRLLGYDLGVAITGTERIGLTLILTEGFGKIPMAGRTFDLLASKEGWKASCSGATQIRAGVIRPEVIIPLDQAPDPKSPPSPLSKRGARGDFPPEEGGMSVGDTVRIIREPYFGLIARVKELPPEPRQIATESKVRVLIASLPDGHDVIIPRANVELIEE